MHVSENMDDDSELKELWSSTSGSSGLAQLRRVVNAGQFAVDPELKSKLMGNYGFGKQFGEDKKLGWVIGAIMVPVVAYLLIAAVKPSFDTSKDLRLSDAEVAQFWKMTEEVFVQSDDLLDDDFDYLEVLYYETN